MIVDNALILSGSLTGNTVAGQLVTSLGNTVSTNTLDIASMSPNQATDLGMGEPLEIAVSVLQTLTSGGAATVQFQLIQADDAALTTGIQVINQTDAFGFATLTAGRSIPLHWDRATPYTPKRYIGVRYVVGTAALTNATGQFFASIVKSVQDPQTSYRSGFAVL